MLHAFVAADAWRQRSARRAGSRAQEASPPKTVRLYVFDCGMLTISTEGVTRYHVTPAEVGESRMPVPVLSRRTSERAR